MNKSKANFFLVGAPKAATTSMHFYLSQHPDIFLTNHKEPHYFCKDFIDDNKEIGLSILPIIESEEEYENFYNEYKAQKIRGEASTTYFYSEAAPLKIKNYNHNAKILILLREPISIMYSWHNYLLYYSQENILDFKEALDAEQQRKNNQKIPSTVFFRDFLYYKNIVQFDKHIESYIECFGSENVHIELFDDIIKKPKFILSRICRFLEVDDSFTFSLNEKKNTKKIVKNASLKRFVDSRTFWLQRKLLPYREYQIMKSLHSIYSQFFSSNENKKSIDKELRSELQRELQPMVEKTSDIIQRDLLDLWNYKNEYV